jgi:hypothetical protein
VTRTGSPAPAPEVDADPDESASARQSAAVLRLNASRQRLQVAWLPGARASRASGAGRSGQRLQTWWQGWRRRLGNLPLLGLALSAGESWWQANPWRMAGESVADEVSHTFVPMVRRHPVLTVSLAAAVGATVVLARPWAWPGVSAQARLLPRRASRWALHQAARAPWAALLAGLAGGAAGTVPRAEPHPPPESP